MRLYDAQGCRLYLTLDERHAFLRAAETSERSTRTFCMTLAYSGCRISEALALTVNRVDFGAGVLVFESLKKRREGVYRAVPIPPAILDALDLVHGVREAQGRSKGQDLRLWPVSRATASRRIAQVMRLAGIQGPQASAKGLRHGFGVQAVSVGIPLNLVQRWLGHAQMSTTAIYANAVGSEEQAMVARMWHQE
ncbi:MAG: tyrosine-type recombinase/integrase [Rhodospirillaceae bacterium]